jgi:hypothetical protein
MYLNGTQFGVREKATAESAPEVFIHTTSTPTRATCYSRMAEFVNFPCASSATTWSSVATGPTYLNGQQLGW